MAKILANKHGYVIRKFSWSHFRFKYLSYFSYIKEYDWVHSYDNYSGSKFSTVEEAEEHYKKSIDFFIQEKIKDKKVKDDNKLFIVKKVK